jgi:hypothetical protein
MMAPRCLDQVVGINQSEQAECKQCVGEPLIRLITRFR